MGEKSRQRRGLFCRYCEVKGAGLANEFIDRKGKLAEAAELEGAIPRNYRGLYPERGQDA